MTQNGRGRCPDILDVVIMGGRLLPYVVIRKDSLWHYFCWSSPSRYRPGLAFAGIYCLNKSVDQTGR